MAEPRQGDGRRLGRPEQTEEAAPLNTSATNFTRTHGFILSDSAPTALECGWWIFSPLGNPQPDMAAFTFRDLNALRWLLELNLLPGVVHQFTRAFSILFLICCLTLWSSGLPEFLRFGHLRGLTRPAKVRALPCLTATIESRMELLLSYCRLTIQEAVTEVPFFVSWRIHQISPIAMGIPKMIRTHSRMRTIDS